MVFADSYKENLETELYGLTPSKLAESIASKEKSSRSSYRREMSTGAGIGERIRLLSTSAENSQKRALAKKVAKIAEVEEESVDISGQIVGRDPSPVSPDADPVVDETVAHESPLHSKTSAVTSRSGSTSPIASAPFVEVRGDRARSVTPTSPTPSDELSQKDSISVRTQSRTPDELRESDSGGAKCTTRAKSPPPSSSSAAMDQLKLLTAVSRGSSAEKREEVSAVKSERLDYEKISMEAAAISREKWKQTEGLWLAFFLDRCIKH